MANWIYGCDICQQVCPFNRFSSESKEPGFFPANIDSAAPHLVDLLQIGEVEFRDRFAKSPIKRIKRRGLVRNSCVAAGNWGNESVVDPLRRLLDDSEPIIRGHAAWALGRIDTPMALVRLEDSLATEDHEDVREEIAAALGGAGREKKRV
jgi:epoxyqueuosine reductase